MRQHQLSRGNLTPDAVLLSREIPHTLGLGFWVMMKRWYTSWISRTKKTLFFIQLEVDELSLQIQSPNVRWLGCIIILSERYLGIFRLHSQKVIGSLGYDLILTLFPPVKILGFDRVPLTLGQAASGELTVHCRPWDGLPPHRRRPKKRSCHEGWDMTRLNVLYCRCIFIYIYIIYNKIHTSIIYFIFVCIYTHASAETTLSFSSFCPSHFWSIHFGSEAMVGSCWMVIPRQDLHVFHLCH